MRALAQKSRRDFGDAWLGGHFGKGRKTLLGKHQASGVSLAATRFAKRTHGQILDHRR